MESTKQKILKMAAKAFAQNGVEATTLREIADGCGIQAPSIFHHFPGGKQQLYDEINDLMIASSAELLTNAVQVGDDKSVLQQLIENLWKFFAANPEYAALSLREMVSPNQDQLSRRMGDSSALVDSAVAYLEAQQADGNIKANINARALTFWVASNVMAFHSLQGLHQVVFHNQDAQESSKHYFQLLQETINQLTKGKQ